ncbi:HAMP domain-containing sensor histidine kinase [Bdellovibrio sp. 22V]|uniref:sensor histidine kinase n=1 Tax=Bdellovibrio sp. 22V TaxID=3044166 RepID=UPI002543813D|nr:HAMP domain-containing sensor histidine kinase [Bdellovibrio sp. 22V]WII72947.1 HAMP domain-containing sensor histidine kinase [Bdellovibrio sp. 22V]
MEASTLEVLKMVKKIYNIDQLLYGKEYVRELVRSLAQTLEVKYVLVGHAVEPERAAIQTDFVWSGNGFAANIVYDLKGTPCVNVICGTRVNCFAERVQQQFPEDKMLKDLGAEAYIGAPFLNPDGGLVGLLIILDDKPLYDRELFTFVVEFFAARIGTEYRRQAFEDSLQHQVNLRTQELSFAFEDLKRTQRQLLSQEKLATIGRITFGIAHELKNPLNVIINGSEVLKDLMEEKNIDGEIKTAVDMVHQQAQRANVIITNMLRQARQEPADAPPENTNLSEMLERCLDLSVRSILDLEFKAKCAVKKDIQPQVEMDLLDHPSVERGFINLIDNALYALKTKFGYLGKDIFTPELFVDLSKVKDHIIIRIRDNGTGISRSNLQRIFDEFYTTKPAGEGTGLGLSIARQVIEKNHGEIKINSKEGEFTEVTVHFSTLDRKEGKGVWSSRNLSP